VGNKEIDLDDMDQEILEMVFDDDLIESLTDEFESEAVKSLMKKLDIEFPEDIFPEEEEVSHGLSGN